MVKLSRYFLFILVVTQLYSLLLEEVKTPKQFTIFGSSNLHGETEPCG